MLDSIPGVLVGGEELSPEALAICKATVNRIPGPPATPPYRIRRVVDGEEKVEEKPKHTIPRWNATVANWGVQSSIGDANGTVIGGAAEGIPRGTLAAKSHFGYTPATYSADRARKVLDALTIGSDAWWCAAQKLVRDAMGLQHPPDFAKLLGRKMIRLNDEGALKFMTKLFPCAKFLLTYRLDVKKQMQSGFWTLGTDSADRPGIGKSLLQNQTRALLKFHDNYPNITFAMPLESISATRYTAMLRWLGVHHCVFKRVVLSNAPLRGVPQEKRKELVINLNNAKGVVNEQSVPILSGTCTFHDA
jgi:hypothetical protein